MMMSDGGSGMRQPSGARILLATTIYRSSSMSHAAGHAGPFLYWLCVMTLPMASAQEDKRVEAKLEKKAFGKTADGTAVDLYVLTNSKGMKAKIITYGGIVTELHVPDRNGRFEDVVLGFDDLKGYLDGHPYFGAICGRVTNRIAKGKFTLDG